MVAIAATPLFMRDVYLTLNVGTPGGEYQCHVSEARVQVTPGAQVDIQTLCSDGTFSQVGQSTYSLVLEGIQDWSDDTTDQGLARFLWEQEGESATFVLNAHGETVTVPTADQPSMEGSVTLIAGDYGGVINEYASLSLELPCLAKPTLNSGA